MAAAVCDPATGTCKSDWMATVGFPCDNTTMCDDNGQCVPKDELGGSKLFESAEDSESGG